MTLFHARLSIVAFMFCCVTTTRVLGDLIPRTPPPKPAAITKPAYESQLTVKFRDDLKARALGGDLTSAVGADLSNVDSVKVQFGLTFHRAIAVPQETLNRIETQASQRSGVAQPDLGGMVVVLAPDENLEQAARTLLTLDEVEWVQFVPTAIPDDPCADIPPATPDYFVLRGTDPDIRDYHGPNPGLDMTCAWVYGARGQGVQVADVETGFIQGHEDLCNIINGNPPEEIPTRDHGAAVLGEMVALDNQYGWTGLAPDVTAWFFTHSPNGSFSLANLRAAIANAIDAINPGDVVLVEVQLAPCCGGCYGPAELDYLVWLLVKAGTDNDKIVVAAAGNGNQNLDGPCYDDYRSWGDSGAIIVGAGTANTNHDRLSFSTYGQRVNVQGWGEKVFTLGYGNYAFLDGDVRQTYTHTFAGTSSASPFVSSVAAVLQSLAEVELGYRLTPAEMRQLLIDTGIPQGAATQATPIGPFPDIAKAILEMGVGSDCQTNGYPDLCDISIEMSQDCNNNGIPDECDSSGACCQSDGSCDFILECPCQDQGGTYKGDGVDCFGVTTLKGACCVGTTCLTNKTECACDALGGIFMGASSKCTPFQCGQFFIPP